MKTGIGLALFAVAFSVSAADLKPATVRAWYEYVSAARARMQQRLLPGSSFLKTDENRDWAPRLRRGEVIVRRGGSQGLTNVPGGTISDWFGAVFIAGVTREQVLAVLNDYDHYDDFYAPVVVASKTLFADGPEYAFSMILTNKAGLVSTTLDTEYESRLFKVNEQCWFSLSESTHNGK